MDILLNMQKKNFIYIWPQVSKYLAWTNVADLEGTKFQRLAKYFLLNTMASGNLVSLIVGQVKDARSAAFPLLFTFHSEICIQPGCHCIVLYRNSFAGLWNLVSFADLSSVVSIQCYMPSQLSCHNRESI